MKKLATIVATSGLVLGLAACGASPEDEAEQAVTDFAQAFEDKDYEKICDSIDPEMVKTMEQGGMNCVDGMKESGEEVAEDEKTATVKVKNKEGEENDVKLIKVEDEWKLSMQ